VRFLGLGAVSKHHDAAFRPRVRTLAGNGPATTIRRRGRNDPRQNARERRALPVPSMIIQVLDIDLADGRHWIDRVVEEQRAQRIAEVRAGSARPPSLGTTGPPR
jgi:hypothetical protein